MPAEQVLLPPPIALKVNLSQSDAEGKGSLRHMWGSVLHSSLGYSGASKRQFLFCLTEHMDLWHGCTDVLMWGSETQVKRAGINVHGMPWKGQGRPGGCCLGCSVCGWAREARTLEANVVRGRGVALLNNDGGASCRSMLWD